MNPPALERPKLRVGICMPGFRIAAWEHRMIELIRASAHAEVVLVIRTAETTAADRAPVGGTFRIVLESLQKALLGRRGFLPDAERRVDAGTLLGDVAAVEISSGGDLVRKPGAPVVGEPALDVVVCLGNAIPEGVEKNARHGAWICRVGRAQPGSDGGRGVREVLEWHPETRSTVEIRRRGADGEILGYVSHASTHELSIMDNLSNVRWKSLHFIPRMLEALRREGAEAFFEACGKADASARADAGAGFPPLTSARLLGLLVRKLVRLACRRVAYSTSHLQWVLLWRQGAGMTTRIRDFSLLAPPAGFFWADPFVIARDGKHYVFIEEGMLATGKGHISVLVRHPDGRWDPAVRVLEKPYHLSYPFIFEFNGKLWMIPESSANRTVELYECTEFPGRWEHRFDLMRDCDMVDSTLVEWNGRWWMFANRIESEGASFWDELVVFSSDNPLSTNWVPHPKNPVVSDVRSARPAGRMFSREGRLFRPSQDCSKHYGYALNVCEITRLTESEYDERIVEKILPSARGGIVSIHTLAHDDGLTLVDAERWHGKWRGA